MSDDDTDDWGVLSGLPGNPLLWILIISELLVFGAFFLGYGVDRALHAAAFRAAQAELDVRLGGMNTIVLVTSGWLAAKALAARKAGLRGQARLWLSGAGVLGACFLLLKGIEYSREFAHGHGLDEGGFFTLFFLMTGFHAAHVVMGLFLLAIVGWKDSIANIETGTAFWHMVDLIWLILFPIVYLVR